MEEQLMHLDYDIEVFRNNFFFLKIFFITIIKAVPFIFSMDLQNIRIAGNQCGVPVYG
jgi:hypothetical protein